MNLPALEIRAIDAIKTHRLTMPIYKVLKSRQNSKRFKVDSVNRFKPYMTVDNSTRFNLVLPTLRNTRAFAGISSALSFFLELTSESQRCRIIIIGNEKYSKKTTYHVSQYTHGQKGVHQNKEIVFFTDGDDLDVGVNDLFIYTSWKTAFSFSPILQWQIDTYKLQERKAIYLIQDFEPGFFPWSSEYLLAESTYSENPDSIIAVFNSCELAGYFDSSGYSFYEKYTFKPVLNASLKEHLLQAQADKANPKQRKKQILVYGRPSEQRNAFEVIRYSLELWSKTYEDACNWVIISLGEGFSDIKLENNTIVSKGKVTLDEYANYMLDSYVGISLMVSPHPSYPPLEMSTFGVRTITNGFALKDLSTFNANIVSISNCSPSVIAKTLGKLCDEYTSHQSELCLEQDYLEGNSLHAVATQARTALLESVK